MNWLKRVVLFIGVGVCAAVAVPAQAKQVDTFLNRPIFDNEFGQIEIKEAEGSDSLSNLSASYARSYDPRPLGKVSGIEDQGNTNTCWAFATIAAIEGNLLKKGYVDSSINLSENHLAYFFFHRENDPLGNTNGDENKALYKEWWDRGGNLQGASLHLATWSGVVNQTAAEDYVAGETSAEWVGSYKPSVLPAGDCYKRDYVVENSYYYNYSVNNVKNAIMEHGAVSVGIYMGTDYLSADQESYYTKGETANHAVTIVGWDDDYSKTNFNSSNRPKSNGAWLVKNSYGTYLHGDGYFYVSYEDASLCELVAYDVERASESDNNNYQYDGSAEPMYLPFASGITFANVYQAKAAGGYDEVLDAASVNLWMTGVRYTMKVYTGVTSKTNPTKGKLVLTQSGTLYDAGYCRIDFNNPITLNAGEKYAIVIELSSLDGSSIPLGVEQGNDANWMEFNAGVSKKVGFVKLNGSWLDCADPDDLGNLDKFNLRIKAYTRSTAQKTTYKLSSKNIGVSKGSTVKLSLTTSPTTVQRKVTWSSANKNVATVSSSGKVKGVSYGTTTIKAKFINGSKTKTLKCKVTVGPSKIKGFKVKGGKKVTVTWKKSSGAVGYEIRYSQNKAGEYKKLGTIKTGSKTKYTKKIKAGTYYVKMRPYMTREGKKLYGSYTSAKKVTIK